MPRIIDLDDMDSYIPTPRDEDMFPFGKHKEQGHTYKEVDASYYMWFMEQDWTESWPGVLQYIKKNYKRIMQEHAATPPRPWDRSKGVRRKQYRGGACDGELYYDESGNDDYYEQR